MLEIANSGVRDINNIDAVRAENNSCVIGESDNGVAVVVPIKGNKTRVIGLSKGKFSIPPDFDAPLFDDDINNL